MNVEQTIEALRRLADEALAEPWDRVGLHVGDPQWPIDAVLLCIDLTPAVLEEAHARQASLIVAYHPPIFQPLTGLTALEPKQKLILDAAMAKRAIYSPHTALDAAVGGVNDWLCDGIGRGNRWPIRTARDKAAQYKLVSFVPVEDADRVREALSDAGAGCIGDYSQCSFNLAGEGTFLGGESTDPHIGQRGQLERVQELRIEMVVPEPLLSRVLAAHREAHPYEEPAYDLYRVEAIAGDGRAGQGRVLELEQPQPVEAVAGQLRRHLGVDSIDIASPADAGPVRRIGVCAGAGGSLLGEAGGVDAFITGEMRHHEVLDAVARGVTVILTGHTETERPYLPTYADRIREALPQPLEILISEADRSPLKRQG